MEGKGKWYILCQKCRLNGSGVGPTLYYYVQISGGSRPSDKELEGGSHPDPEMRRGLGLQ